MVRERISVESGNITDIGTSMGYAQRGTIVGINRNAGTVQVKLTLTKSDYREEIINMPIPAAWQGPNGQFAGGFPVRGASVRCVLGQGGEWSILGYTPSDDIFTNTNTFGTESFEGNLMGELRPGRYLIQTTNNIRQFIDPVIGIEIGNPEQFIQADPNASILSNTFQQNMGFTQAHQSVTGQVRRDLKANSNRNITDSALSGHEYQKSLTIIGLDPLTKTGDDFVRNPPYVESRSIVYEYERDFGFTNDRDEISIYDNRTEPPLRPFTRDQTRADAFSLSLEFPNHLMEEIKGTGTDVYGNVIDLNRSILPAGAVDSLSFRNNESNLSDVFLNLRNLSRRSLAYHWELNARKDLGPQTPDVTKRDDYARDRSRFFLDIDKEGQFKMNVPASSEKGNVALQTRYENFSTLRAAEEGDLSQSRLFIRNVDNQDIFLEGTNTDAENVTINPGSEDSPTAVDRFSDNPIGLGTAFHNIESDSLLLQKRENPIFGFPDSLINSIPPIGNLVSPEISNTGDSANAGGRSGTITLDGSLNLSVGANTSDRQSLWADFAGGVLMNVGRDLNNRSLGATFDGDVLVQVGGATVSNDSRFPLNNAVRDGVIDIRVVFGNGMMSVLRFDSSGILIHTPGRLDIVSEGDLQLKSVKGTMSLNAKNIFCYSDNADAGRLIARTPNRTV